MGVPKFYRWISERYPCLSEVIKEYQIPQFDNLYLDMNGIIHVCSHPNDDDPHFRITEEKIFADICHYLDFLFKMIKPQKVFFMAVDGVAPRAKMNQQRGRRFRTARDALMLEQKARDGGESLPTEARFDSNCITPGTAFMVRLHDVLKNFVVYKLSTDKLWQNVKVYLSGHETPGEGEHKIMDFIRYEKSQKNYDPNTRHCLYGLDADLIMLGLCSHEPHFSLLREEVRFGKKANQKRIMTPEETTFHLLHLSLLREYLEYEFMPAKSKIDFEFDIEKIIDDFVLMSFLVGNDFIPHLPQLHIHHDALPTLFQSYIDALPTLGGYINEDGFLNLERFEKFFKKLAEFDYMKFGEVSEFAPPGSKTKSEIYDEDTTDSCLEKLTNLGFSEETLSKTTEFDSGSDDENDDSLFTLEFEQHKRDYYRNKLEFENVTANDLREQAEGYVRAIQWNLHYYYNGVPSWGWYYPHHYAPYISDVKDFKNMSLNFELGEPFLPFQQLLSVLPSLSKELLPMTYQILMTDESSPLISFYPPDFETDLNGKKQDWEAVVLIPFIKEDLLLKHAAEADKSLTPDERQRNRHGPHLLYTYSKKATRGLTPSFLPAFFPPLESHHSKCQELDKNFFRLSPEQIKKGLCDGAHLDVHFTGFPTLKHIKHTAHLSNEDVKVFQMISQRDNMILTVTDIVEPDLKKAADSMLGKIIHVGWPHLVKGCVEMVADAEETYSLENDTVVKSPTVTDIWKSMVDSVKEHHTKRLGIILGDVGILVHAKSLTGSKLLWDEKIMEEIQWTERCSQFPYKTIVKDLEDHSPERKIQKNCKDLYPIGSSVFMLGSPYYGCMGTVSDNDVIKNRGTIIVKFEIPDEPDMKSVIKNKKKLASLNYMPGYILAQHLGISGYFLSRLTGTLLIQTNSKESIGPNKVNVGLNLKFNKKNEEVVGYSKKTEDNQWLYSDQVFETLEKYLSQFPEFFEKLVPLAKGDIVYLEDLYPNGEGREVIKEVTNWLKCQQYYSAERQVCGLNTLDEGIVAAIEDVVNSATATRKVTSKNIFVKPQDLYNPYLCKGCVIPDSKANYQLFDRVINVSHTLTVPLGRRGTIIGIRTADKLCDYVYEVVFDQDFFGGIKIHCSPGRGYRMPPSALINISYGDRLYGKPRSPRKRINIDQVTNILGSHLSSNSTLPNTNVSQFARNTLFSNDSTAFGSPQVQILRKEGPQSPFNSPVSENDSVASPQIINHSPLSGFVTQGAKYNDWFERFTIPNINQTRNSTGSSKTMPANDKEYDAVWDGMLNKMSEKSSPAKHPIEKDSKPHGKSVTVQELFNAFENQVEPKIMADGAHAPSQPSPVLQQPLAPPQPPLTQQQFSTTSQLLPTQQQPSAPVAQPKQVATMELLSLCINLFGQPPTYSYNQLHFNHWHIATVALPDGRMIASVQCPNRIDATENAAEKALIILRGHVPPQFKQKPPLMSKPPEIGNFRHAYQPQVPYFQNVHSEYRMPFPSIIPNAPPPVYSSNGPSIRYPTVRVPLIPESFVKQNQMILAGHVPKAESMHIVPSRTIPILPSQDSMKLKDNEHYVLKSKESVFVPLQVSRNSTKKPPPPPETSLNLLDTEWPSLSASEKKAPSLDPCLTPLSFTNSSTVETKSLIKSPKEIILGKSSTAVTEERHVVVTRAPSTTPKPRKPRIAANIPNLS